MKEKNLSKNKQESADDQHLKGLAHEFCQHHKFPYAMAAAGLRGASSDILTREW